MAELGIPTEQTVGTGYFWLGLKHTGWFTLNVREKCVAPVGTWWTKTTHIVVTWD